MANIAVADASARPAYGSMSRDRRWALRWSYFFLVLFAIFFLMPPIYMLITSLKTGRLLAIEVPKSPCKARHTQLTNCSG